jgi:kumamolisin
MKRGLSWALVSAACAVVIGTAGCRSDDSERASTAPPPSDAPKLKEQPADPPELAQEIFLPDGADDVITFYYTLPADADGLHVQAEEVSTPGAPGYRKFMTLAEAAHQFGAQADDITDATKAVRDKGLTPAVDPSRLFMRVSGTAEQWEQALGKPLEVTAASGEAPFEFHRFPDTPDFADAKYVHAGATLYRADLDTGEARGSSANNAADADANAAWPANSNGPYGSACEDDGYFENNSVFTPSQIAAAYGTDKLRAKIPESDVRVAIVDLGGGFDPDDIAAAAECFDYPKPKIDVHRGDGVGEDGITNNNDETQLDLQTMAAALPGANIELVQTANGPASLLDALSRAVGHPRGAPDVASISYGQCALQEESVPELIRAIHNVIALGAVTGMSVLVSSGDSGSTTCGKDEKGTSQSFAATSPWVTAVGGTRLSLANGNARDQEVSWNDSEFGSQSAGGGGPSKVFDRPWYQDGLVTDDGRAVPDVAALAAIMPGWPVFMNGSLGSIGGTSGSTPFIAANVALLNARERAAGRPPLGFINPWLYRVYDAHPDAFHDVVEGNNDLNNVGCCSAAEGFDNVTGMGVPDWIALEQYVEPPAL